MTRLERLCPDLRITYVGSSSVQVAEQTAFHRSRSWITHAALRSIRRAARVEAAILARENVRPVLRVVIPPKNPRERGVRGLDLDDADIRLVGEPRRKLDLDTGFRVP
jgi:hypothetical protein